MVRISGLHFAFGDRLLFDDVKLSIGRGERIGLLGRNGSGKTTLLNILSGRQPIDKGVITTPREYSVGHLEQRLHFTQDNVLKEAQEARRARKSRLPSDSEEVEESWKAEKILFGLGFSEKQCVLGPGELSAGFQIRLSLAKVLLEEPDLLLLDEPTNYLDIISIRWLEGFLRGWPGELVVITHDRSFMDSISTHTMIIHRRGIRKIEGSTSKLYNQIAKEEEVYEKTRINDEKRRREVEIFINRFRAKARLAGLVQSRIKSLQKKTRLDKLERIESLDFSFHTAPFRAKIVAHVRGLCFAYPSSGGTLIDNFSMAVGKNDRIGVVGKNGMGKSTLLRLFAGELIPLQGEIVYHPSASIGYFGPSRLDLLHDEKTIEEELGSTVGTPIRSEIMNVCGAMMFGGDDSQKRIAVLSGGERSRVVLGKILLTPVNLLLLDEPTNHLDMESCDSLVSAVDRFDGAVLIATHNELFLHHLATRLIVFDGDNPFIFEGSYQDFLDRLGWSDERERGYSAADGKQEGSNRKSLRTKRAAIVAQRSSELRPMEKRIDMMEAEIQDLENRLHENNAAIIEASAEGRSELIGQLSWHNHRMRTTIEQLYLKLEGLLQEHENRFSAYEERLRRLE
jgi:ATP-binding cassette subfamily F protein 3